MARMLGTFSRPCCPQCRTGWGPDCPDKSRGRKAQRAHEKRTWLRDYDEDIFVAWYERHGLAEFLAGAA